MVVSSILCVQFCSLVNREQRQQKKKNRSQLTKKMSAPRAKFDRIYTISPIKVAIIFLTSLHCLFLLISLLTSFWIETNYGHFGPLFSCVKRFNRRNYFEPSIITKCYLGRFFYDNHLLWRPLTAILMVLSFSISIISIIIASSSLLKNSLIIRRRYWLCTIILLLFVCLIDCFILIFIPISYQHQKYHLQWAYGVHCGATLFIFASLITAIVMRNTDDIQYIEAIDKSSIKK
jgi:hypothetical protein